MKRPAIHCLLAMCVLAACQTSDRPDLDQDLGEVSPAIYLMDGYVELPPVRTLNQCAEAVRAGARSANPKSLGRFTSNPQSLPNAFLGGCITPRGYFWVSASGVEPFGPAPS